MKQTFRKKLAAFSLISFIMLSLCSCGGTAAESNENRGLAKEHVYRFREAAIPDPGGNETEILASACKEQTIFLLVKVINREKYNDNDIRFYSKAPQNPDEEALSKRYLCCWGMDGGLLWKAELEDFGFTEEYVSINAISIAKDSTARLVLTEDAHAWQMSVNAQGIPADAEKLPEDIFLIFCRSEYTKGLHTQTYGADAERDPAEAAHIYCIDLGDRNGRDLMGKELTVRLLYTPDGDNDADGYWFVKPEAMGTQLTLKVIHSGLVSDPQGNITDDSYEVLYEIPIELK